MTDSVERALEAVDAEAKEAMRFSISGGATDKKADEAAYGVYRTHLGRELRRNHVLRRHAQDLRSRFGHRNARLRALLERARFLVHAATVFYVDVNVIHDVSSSPETLAAINGFVAEIDAALLRRDE